MAIARNGSASSGQDTDSSSFAFTAPSSIAAGEILIASLAFSSVTTITTVTPPSGWTQFAKLENVNNTGLWGYWKLAGGSEPSTYTWSFSNSDVWVGGTISRFSGVDTTTPIDVTAVTVTDTASTLAITAVTTTVADTMLITGISQDSQTQVFTAPSGMTKETQPTSGASQAEALAYVLQASAGTTGTKTWTAAGAERKTGWLTALRPSIQPPANLTESAVTDTTATLTWSASSGAAGYELLIPGA